MTDKRKEKAAKLAGRRAHARRITQWDGGEARSAWVPTLGGEPVTMGPKVHSTREAAIEDARTFKEYCRAVADLPPGNGQQATKPGGAMQPGLFDQLVQGLDEPVQMPEGYSLYGGSPPAQAAETSREAAAEVRQDVGRLRERVLGVLRRHGSFGATDAEIEAATGMIHQTASARRRELVQLGLVQASGRKRRTPNGRRAQVWVLGPLTEPLSDSEAVS